MKSLSTLKLQRQLKKFTEVNESSIGSYFKITTVCTFNATFNEFIYVSKIGSKLEQHSTIIGITKIEDNYFDKVEPKLTKKKSINMFNEQDEVQMEDFKNETFVHVDSNKNFNENRSEITFAISVVCRIISLIRYYLNINIPFPIRFDKDGFFYILGESKK